MAHIGHSKYKMLIMESHLRKTTGLGVIAFAIAWTGGVAHAQNEDDAARTERARELFLEGLELSDQGEWGDAAQRFEAALELRDAPTIRYNLGTSLLSLERPVEAANQFDIARAHPEATPELVAQAEEQLATLELQLSRVEIVVEGFENDPRVIVDGVPLPPEQLIQPLWVEPGHHVAVAEQEGMEVARAEVDVLAGGQGALTLRNIPQEAVVPSEVGLEGQGDDGHDDESTPLARDWRLWVGVGGGVVVLALALGLGLGLGLDHGTEDPIVGTMNPGVIEWP